MHVEMRRKLVSDLDLALAVVNEASLSVAFVIVFQANSILLVATAMLSLRIGDPDIDLDPVFVEHHVVAGRCGLDREGVCAV